MVLDATTRMDAAQYSKNRRIMKIPSFFGFAFLLLVSLESWLHPLEVATVPSTVWTEQTLSGEKVYYFLEAQCTDCIPGEGQLAGKYIIVTAGLESADYADHYQLLERFRATLAAQFPKAPALRDGLEFRFEFSMEEAEKFRQTELEQKRTAGYQVIELDVTQ